MRAIILAGGKGTRLKPYTTLIPKPLVPIGGKYPILEIVIRQLADQGFTHITLTVNHLSHLIKSFFGDGSRWNIKVDYSEEDRPLSTIGPLTMIDDLPEDFLVMNGDIITDINFKELLDSHKKGKHRVTVSTYEREQKVDFGVIEANKNSELTGFEEKPIKKYNVSMGIYCINKSVITSLLKNEPYGFDNLMLDSIKNSDPVNLIPFNKIWYDIGRPSDYDHVNENFESIEKTLKLI
jgi:NDP-sugar pyrophosphorylase family protein